ncbi:mucin-22-like [Pecten maximus]|uniref:mucin-22-like n=1 Tax=Pecten maximus TaxID=6579 RepID=UPI001458B15E|nr:mucin-22-like [Pecten maximus]XP_033732459.1 mucin-22-like [Pecten maximus]
MENHQGNAVFPQLATVDHPIVAIDLESGHEDKSVCDRDNNVRKSVRCKRPPQSFSPGLDGTVGERNESSKTKKQRTKSATAPDRPCDLMPNGDPFLCDLCMSPYVINRSLKRSLKNKRSKHNPAPRNKMDPLTGKILMLCNACSITFDRPRKPRKIVPVPTAEEMEKYLEGAKHFAKHLAEKMNRPEAERLYCPVVRPKTCACLQRYISGDGDSDGFDTRAKAMIDLLMKAKELSSEKCYSKDIETKRKRMGPKNQGIGIGNGQKRSKAFEEFVLSQRTYLKNDIKLCERAVQKVLMYSNNFLHKKLVTEKSLCRAKPVNGMARKGLLQPFDTLPQTRCCVDNCVMMAITHKKLLQDWRNRSNKGQSEHRRVIAEMLTPSAGARTNCYTFITMVTGSSRSTIVQVSHQMKQTGGEREPPTHGMKKFWQCNSRRKSTETMSPTKNSSNLGKTSSSTTFTHSVAPPISKQSMTASSHNSTTASNIIIPVSVNSTSSGGSSLTVQRQQLLQIQQQMFEQQVQQQQQQHLLQQQLLQHTIMQQIGQATDGMPQNLPMLQTMIDQLNVQIQNTQQQLQLSLRTMNMIGSQPVGSGAIGSTQNMLTNAENSSVIETTSRGNFLGVESAPNTHSNLIQICGTLETANLSQQQSSVMASSNIGTHIQTSDQGGLGQTTNQILSTLSPQDQQYLNQLSPSQMQGQTHSRMNNSQNYCNNLSLQSNGQTIIQVQQSPAIPSSHHTQYVQTFVPGSQLNKGRGNLNDNGSLEQFVIQTYPSTNQCVQENPARSSQNSVLVQQLNAPVNQGPRLTVPPLLLVNQQQVDCGDGLPSASHLSKELYDIPESGYQQNSTRIDTEHSLLHTPILDLTPSVVTPFVSVPSQTITESTLGTVSVIGQTVSENTLRTVNVIGQTTAENMLGTVNTIGQTTTENMLETVNVIGQATTENMLGTVNVIGQTTTENTLGTVSTIGQTNTENTLGTVNVINQTTTENTVGTVNVIGQTISENTLRSVNVHNQTTTENTLGTVNLIGQTESNPESMTIAENTTIARSIPGTSTVTTIESVTMTAQNTKESVLESAATTDQNVTDRTPEQTIASDTSKGRTEGFTSVCGQTNKDNSSITMSGGQTMLDNASMSIVSQSITGSRPGSPCVAAVSSTCENTQLCNIPVKSSYQSVVCSSLVTSVLAEENNSFPDRTTNNIGCHSYTVASNMRMSQTSTNTKPVVTIFHTSPKSAFHTPQKLAVATSNCSTVCTPSTNKSLQVENAHTHNMQVTNSLPGNLHENMNIDVVHNTRVSNVSVTSLSTSKSRSKTTRRSRTTKVTQSRFPTSSVSVIPSTPLNTSTFLSVPLIQAIPRGKSNTSLRQLPAFSVSPSQKHQNCAPFLHASDSQTHSSVSEFKQHLQENALNESHVRIQHTAANAYSSTIEKDIHHATRKSTDVIRTDRAKSAPLSLSSPGSRNKGTDEQNLVSSSQVSQDSVYCNVQTSNNGHSTSSHGKNASSYPSNPVARLATQSLIGNTAESTSPYSVSVATPLVKTVSNTSHHEFLNVPGPQLQNKVGSLQQSGKDTHVPETNSHQQPPKKLSLEGISTSTVHVGSQETPVSDSILPINCTLVINPSQNQRAMVGTGQNQPIIGQIQPMLPNVTTHTRTQLLVESKNTGDQRTQSAGTLPQSATTLPLVPNTTFTIDSDTLMRLCQQASLLRTPVVSVDMNPQVSKNL